MADYLVNDIKRINRFCCQIYKNRTGKEQGLCLAISEIFHTKQKLANKNRL